MHFFAKNMVLSPRIGQFYVKNLIDTKQTHSLINVELIDGKSGLQTKTKIKKTFSLNNNPQYFNPRQILVPFPRKNYQQNYLETSFFSLKKKHRGTPLRICRKILKFLLLKSVKKWIKGALKCMKNRSPRALCLREGYFLRPNMSANLINMNAWRYAGFF